MYKTIHNIRQEFLRKFKAGEIVINDTGSLSGSRTIEIIGASFIATEESIFGIPNKEYIGNEIEWYTSESLSVNDIPGGAPAIWKAVSSKSGMINSNYGYLVFSEDNCRQAENAIDALVRNNQTRQAVMIYTRPSIHYEYNTDGMLDFICTNAVQYVIRNNQLEVIVQMRSNDAVFGFLNDIQWQMYMQAYVMNKYNDITGFNVQLGRIFWQVGSLHIYETHFYLLDHFDKTNEFGISKKSYNKLYNK